MAVILNASTSTGFVQSADTSGEINLQSNGTTKLTVASTGVSGTLVQGTAVSASGTAVDFTGIPSWAKRITVMFSGVSTNGTSNLQVQLGDSGGIETTGYAGTLARGDNTRTAFSAGFLFGAQAATDSITGNMVITNISGTTWTETSTVVNEGGGNIWNAAGKKALSDTLTQIRITATNGTDTFDAGSINIQYEG